MLNFWKKLKKPILALAPMAGVTDSAFRQLCRKYGADVVYTEMVSADGLYYNSKKTLEFLKFNKKEHPVVIQLFGKHPEKFTKAAQICEQAGFDGIDINFGCPAKKVAGHGGGVTLMRDLPKCREIIEAVLAGLSAGASASPAKRGESAKADTKLPVSVKLRSSIKKESGVVTALDFIKFMKGLPLAAVTIHGRPYENPFNAKIDYEIIKKVKRNFSGVVLANGGIKTPQDAKIMLEKTDADGLGIARGVYGQPWIFKQIREYLSKGEYHDFSQKQVKKVILEQAALALENKGQHGIVELRKHLLWYVSGWPRAQELRSRLVKVENIKQMKNIFNYE